MIKPNKIVISLRVHYFLTCFFSTFLLSFAILTMLNRFNSIAKYKE